MGLAANVRDRRRQSRSRRKFGNPELANLSDDELLDLRFCDLGLAIEDTPLQQRIEQLSRELESKRLNFRPPISEPARPPTIAPVRPPSMRPIALPPRPPSIDANNPIMGELLFLSALTLRVRRGRRTRDVAFLGARAAA